MSRLKKLANVNLDLEVNNVVETIKRNILYPAITEKLKEICNQNGWNYDPGMDELIINNPKLDSGLTSLKNYIVDSYNNDVDSALNEVIDDWQKDTFDQYHGQPNNEDENQ